MPDHHAVVPSNADAEAAEQDAMKPEQLENTSDSGPSQAVPAQADGSDSDDDALLDELDSGIGGFNMEAFREARMEQIRANAAERAREADRDARADPGQGNANYRGRYTEIKTEKELLYLSSSEPNCIIHFAHPDFKRCALMDRHLERLAPRYPSVSFLKIFVENAPFLVDRLKVQVLPAVFGFVNGVSRDKLIGFEALGNNDAFTTTTLEIRLQSSGVLPKAEPKPIFGAAGNAVNKTIRGGQDNSDDDLDWD